MNNVSISSRLNEINRELVNLSQLQRMEGELFPRSRSEHRKDKPCRCAFHASLMKERHTQNCIQRRFQSNNQKLPCNNRTCNAREIICLCRARRHIEARTDFGTEDSLMSAGKVTQVPNNTAGNTETSIINDSVLIVEGTRSSADQTDSDLNSSKRRISDKAIDSYEKDNVRTDKETTNYQTALKDFSSRGEKSGEAKDETSIRHTTHTVERTNGDKPSKDGNGVEAFENGTEEILDAKYVERIRKDLLNERKRTKELEEKLKNLTCSVECLKEDQEQKAACLKEAIKTTEERAHLATESRDLAMDLVKQLRKQADTLKRQLAEVTDTNTALTQERDDLKRRLEALSENEAKRCGDVEEEVNKIKSAFREKEDALNKEKEELKQMISELTNVTKIQKKKVGELIGICNNQQCQLQEKEKELYQRNGQLNKFQNTIKQCQCKKLQEKVKHLEYSLEEMSKTCKGLKEDLELLKENSSSELRIKEKIIDEQNKMITRQRKLLHDSEKMAEQASYEFDHLKSELYCERERSSSLQMALDEMDTQYNKETVSECENCKMLKSKMDHLIQEKDETLAATKLAIQKLYQSAWAYQNQVVNERENNRRLMLTLQRKQVEIEYLRRQESC